jgi:uncharacterized repeat protein (TIGR03806 family)
MLLCVMSASACDCSGGASEIDGGGSGGGGTATGGGAATGGGTATDAGSDAGVSDAGPWGYDTRPANEKCIAPNPPPNLSGVATQRVFPNLTFVAPMGMLQAPGEPTRIFIMERNGRIRVFPNSQTAVTGDVRTFLDFSAKVNGQGEGGFLGMAFHPQWATRKEVFVSYTETGVAANSPLRSVVARFRSTDDGATLDPGSEERVLLLDQPYTNHNGGNIAFGPDGSLYIGFGDGGSGGDPLNSGQRLNTLLGKMLRIDVNVSPAQKYTIPALNPYASQADGGLGTPCNRLANAWDAPLGTQCAEIFAYGFRNPWRWSFDTVSGELWVGDVGQNQWEEVDRVVIGGNYGWRLREGMHCHSPASNCPTAGLIEPVVEYSRAEGQSITGGFVYRGSLIPSLVGKFVYGDYQTGRIWAVNHDPLTGAYTGALLQDTNINMASFGQTLDGEVYAVGITDGRLYQLVPAGLPPPDTFPRLLSATGCFDATDPKRPVAALIPYDLNAALWSDGAQKDRSFAIPDGQTIRVNAEGDFVFPNGTVTVKTFSLAGKRIETRLLMRHLDGTWAGYSYEWNDTETDATLLTGSKSKVVGAQTWYFPSRAQCLACHTAVAGHTLGPEVAQLNLDFQYPSGRVRNQLETLQGLGYFEGPLAQPVNLLPKLAPPFGTGPLEDRARAYLHANCSGCHRMGAGQGPADFRAALTVRQMNICDVMPSNGAFGIANARILAPGSPTRSLISYRTHALTAARMPPLGTSLVDPQGTALLDQWMTSLTTCP